MNAARPRSAGEALSHFGRRLYQRGELMAAAQAYEAALRYDRNHAPAINGLGGVLHRFGRIHDALACYRRAVELDGRFIPALLNMTLAGLQSQHYDDAEQTAQAVLRIQPDHLNALEALLKVYQRVCDWSRLSAVLPRFWQAAEQRMARSEHCHLSLLDLYALPLDARQMFALVANHGSHLSATFAAERRCFDRNAVVQRRRQGPGKVRLGYVSPDFRNHPVANHIWELFALHDRERFEVYAYSLGPDDGSPYRGRLAGDADVFRDLYSLSVAQSIAVIRNDAVDILIDLGGYTGFARPELFAARSAVLQISYLGYCGTLGADYMDYLVTDRVLSPPSHDDLMSEKALCLPVSSQLFNRCQPVPAAAGDRARWGLPADRFVFCAFHRFEKIDEQSFTAWMAILNAVSDSVLWLNPAPERVRRNLESCAHRQGVDPRRLIFAAPQKLDKQAYVDRQQCADLFLDTFRFNAHSTASAALWAGVPVLTCPGDQYISRAAASLVYAAGLRELITDSVESYQATAVALANDRRRLARLRRCLVEGREHLDLFNTVQTVRRLESGYQDIWRDLMRAAPVCEEKRS